MCISGICEFDEARRDLRLAPDALDEKRSRVTKKHAPRGEGAGLRLVDRTTLTPLPASEAAATLEVLTTSAIRRGESDRRIPAEPLNDFQLLRHISVAQSVDTPQENLQLVAAIEESAEVRPIPGLQHNVDPPMLPMSPKGGELLSHSDVAAALGDGSDHGSIEHAQLAIPLRIDESPVVSI